MNTEALIRSRRTVLVVEDEAVNRDMLGFILQDQYRLLFAANGREALDTLESYDGPVAMILLDIYMPVMNGFEFLDALQKSEKWRGVPVIVLTSDRDAELEALNRGAADFIPKPYDMPAVILARVRRIIELTENRRLIRDIERDPLTGLYSRSVFCEYCDTLIKERRDTPMDMIAVDVDRFRLINEINGKPFGEAVLRAVAEGIRDLLSHRLGLGCRAEADQFFILTERLPDYGEALDCIQRRLSEQEGLGSMHLRMGVYENADPSHPASWYCAAAGHAADSSRGNHARGVTVYDSAMVEKELYSQRLISDLDEGLRQGQFKVFYQPKYLIQGEAPRLYGAEALVRWAHPELGFISPGVFIPLLEENGLITRLDVYVWREAAAQLRRWRDALGFAVPVSVNLSRQDLFDAGLPERLLEIVAENGLTTGDLRLEITESAYAHDMDHVLRSVEALRSAGFRIEMDDFGAGYSSLSMLSVMPIDALKIDMKFVQNIMRAEGGYPILQSVVNMSHSMRLPAIVEGVETQEQYDLVRRAGCDVVQGYYFARPAEAAAFTDLLRRGLAGDASSADSLPPYAPAVRRGRPERIIAQALSQELFTIFYVDMQTDAYIEYHAHTDTGMLTEAWRGENFFADGCQRVRNMMPPEDQDKLLRVFDKSRLMRALDAEQTFRVTARMLLDGRPTYVTLKATRVDSEGTPHIVVGVSNVDAQIRREMAFVKELGDAQEKVNRDALTGVKSKHAFLEAERQLDGRIAEGRAEPFAVAVCDVNGLKAVNDALGHKAGDLYICQACAAICGIFQHSPVFRVGGDEFAVLLRGADYERREELAEAVARLSRDNLQSQGVVIACGVADYLPGRDQHVASVFSRADTVMYRHKQSLKGAS